MAFVILPNVYVLPQQEGHLAAEVRVSAQTWAEVYREIATRFPQLRDKLLDADGNPEGWFELYRDEDGESLRYFQDAVIGADEKLLLVYAIGD